MKPAYLFEYEPKGPYKTLVAIPDLRHVANRRVIASPALGSLSNAAPCGYYWTLQMRSPCPSTRNLLGVNPGVHPGRPRGMRHRLPHTRGIGGRMLLLLFPRRALGDSGTVKLIDRRIPA